MMPAVPMCRPNTSVMGKKWFMARGLRWMAALLWGKTCRCLLRVKCQNWRRKIKPILPPSPMCLPNPLPQQMAQKTKRALAALALAGFINAAGLAARQKPMSRLAPPAVCR